MIRRRIELSHEHRVLFCRDVFGAGGEQLAGLLEEGWDEEEGVVRVLVLVDRGLAEGKRGLLEQLVKWVEERPTMVELAGGPVVMEGGEGSKNDWAMVERVWGEINGRGIDRHSQVWALGGGAFLDLVGFAAATAHRGVRHIRFPSTSLSQGDGGVGVKNGVNHFGKKNWVGTFSVPYAVVNDLDFLDALPARGKRDGIIEGIKVALIRDEGFFGRIEARQEALGALEPGALEWLVRESAKQHVDHIASAGDPFELGSARPLDFGHWSAHKLEQITDFRVTHGEAVAVGMAVDLVYAWLSGWLGEGDMERALMVIEGVGFLTYHEGLEIGAGGGRPPILDGLEEFREHLGGRLTVTLVPEIGSKIEVNRMDEGVVLEAMAWLRRRCGL
jgi:3-dehydroquinate synthase